MSGWKMWKRAGRVVGATAGLMLLTHCGGAAEPGAQGEAPAEDVSKQAASLASCQQVVRYTDIPVELAEDAYVVAAQPDTSFGGGDELLVDGDPQMEAYVRVSVDPSVIQGSTVTGARLQLYAFDGSTDGPALYRTGTNWSEDTLTWNNRPARVGAAVGDLGAVASGAYVEYDVSTVVTGAGNYAFALVPTGGNGVDFYAKEKSAAEPRLVLTVARSLCERGGSGGDLAWGWARGGADEQELRTLAMDPQGGFVVASTFYGAGNYGGQTFTASHGLSLVKYAANGTHQWSRLHLPYKDINVQLGINDMVVTPLGNILLVGHYQGTPDFGGGPLPALPSGATWGMYIAKFSPTGAHVWSRGFVPTGDGGASVSALARAVTTDANGSLIVTGCFTGWLNLGGGTLQSGETFSQSGMFLARFSWEGEHLWSLAVPAGTSNPWSAATEGLDVATNADGRIFVGGQAGTGRLGATSDSTPFVAAYSPEGALLWSRALNGAVGAVRSVATLPGGSVAFGGSFRESFVFAGAPVVSTANENGHPDEDGMLGVLSPAGGDTWAKRLGGVRYDAVNGVATDAAGNISILGYSNGLVDLGGGVLGHPEETRYTVARFSSTGVHRWSRVLDPRLSPTRMGVSLDGGTVVGADFDSPVNVDSSTYYTPLDQERELLFLKFGP